MKTKIFITLSTCLLFLSCCDKKQSEKKILLKPTAKISKKAKHETKKDENMYDFGCGHVHGVPSSVYVSTTLPTPEYQKKLKKMLPEEIRKDIQKMVVERKIDELGRMCNYLSQIGDYDNAFLIANNFITYAETETEKQMAASFYANLSANAFSKRNKTLNDRNRGKYENVKSLLINSLDNTPDNIDYKHAFLISLTLQHLSCVLQHYEMDVDAMFNLYDASVQKIERLKKSKQYFDATKCHIFINSYMPIQYPENYDKIRISDQNIDRLLKFFDGDKNCGNGADKDDNCGTASDPDADCVHGDTDGDGNCGGSGSNHDEDNNCGFYEDPDEGCGSETSGQNDEDEGCADNVNDEDENCGNDDDEDEKCGHFGDDDGNCGSHSSDDEDENCGTAGDEDENCGEGDEDENCGWTDEEDRNCGNEDTGDHDDNKE